MEIVDNLLFSNGVAHTIFIVACVIAVGLMLNKIRIGSLSLGVTWVLFVGIVVGHFGLGIDPETCHFLKEFGLILFIYSIGLEVGPGFFSSFRKGGITYNALAAGVVLLGCITLYVITLLSGEDLSNMTGVMCGAVTNTPSLGAAQQTYYDMTGVSNSAIAQGYAVAYPLGVVGLILVLAFFKKVFKIDFKKEDEIVLSHNSSYEEKLDPVTLEVHNRELCGKSLYDIQKNFGRKVVFTRVMHNETHDVELANSRTTLQIGDRIFMVAPEGEIPALKLLIGPEVTAMGQAEWDKMQGNDLTAGKIVITKAALNGKRLGDLRVRETFDVNISRIRRAGVELVATPQLLLQLGDRLNVVGTKENVKKISDFFGNSVKRLDEPNLTSLFFGIALGVLLGSLPIAIPSMPVPVKLGLAGGPLIISIILSKFGPKYGFVTFTTSSANHMIRQIGITLFLASVGLSAGDGFVETIIGGGYWWILYGGLITIIPCLLIGFIARKICHLSYYAICGILAGSMTDPPALAYGNEVCGNNHVSVAYSTVYPLSMFLRVITAQVIILMAL